MEIWLGRPFYVSSLPDLQNTHYMVLLGMINTLLSSAVFVDSGISLGAILLIVLIIVLLRR